MLILSIKQEVQVRDLNRRCTQNKAFKEGWFLSYNSITA